MQYPDSYIRNYESALRKHIARLASIAHKYEADGTSPQEYRRALELVGERAFNHGLGLERARASRTS